MCSYYCSSKLNREIEDSFGFIDLVAICGGVLKSMSSQISAKRGYLQSQILDVAAQLLAFTSC
ncbi:hypothetical protein D3C74_275570 [compost metagenome]